MLLTKETRVVEVELAFIAPLHLREYYGYPPKIRVLCRVPNPPSLLDLLYGLKQELESWQEEGGLQGVNEEIVVIEKSYGERLYLIFTFLRRAFLLISAESPDQARAIAWDYFRDVWPSEGIINCYRVHARLESSPATAESEPAQTKRAS